MNNSIGLIDGAYSDPLHCVITKKLKLNKKKVTHISVLLEPKAKSRSKKEQRRLYATRNNAKTTLKGRLFILLCARRDA